MLAVKYQDRFCAFVNDFLIDDHLFQVVSGRRGVHNIRHGVLKEGAEAEGTCLTHA